MAVTLNNAGGAWGDGFNTTLTGSVTVASGTGRALIAFTNDACTGVTYGGVSLTLLNTVTSGVLGGSFPGTKSWILDNPTVGTANLVATRASSNPMMLAGIVFNGWDNGSTPTFHSAVRAAQPSPQSLSCTVASGGMAVNFIIDNLLPTNSYTGASGTTKANEFTAASYFAYATGYKADATSIDWSWTGGDRNMVLHTVVLAGVASAPVITGPSGSAGAASSTANIAENASTGPTFTTDIALGGGYPTLTGAQAANWAITALSSTSWRVDPVTPFNFEAGGLVNPQAIVFNASASVSQSCSVTVTNVNEAPTFSGTVSVPTLTQGSAMTPVNAGALFSEPDSGDTAAYSAVGVWPAGVTVDGSTGIISGTPSAAASYANLRVRRTDAGTLTADSNLFTITVAASGGVTFSGTVPAQSGTVGTAFSLALTSYFSGTGTYAVQAGTLPTGLSLDSSTGAITGTPSAAGTFSGVVIRKTAASGSPATADTNAFAFTIAAAPAVAGFDMDTAAGCVFGAVAGSLTSISREVSVAYKVAVYNTSTRALIFESASLTTNSAGRLPRFTTGLCTIGVTYDLVAKRVSDGAIACFRLAAT